MTIWQDLRFAVRLLIKDRWFTAVAVVALALGIGVNSTVFTRVDDDQRGNRRTRRVTTIVGDGLQAVPQSAVKERPKGRSLRSLGYVR